MKWESSWEAEDSVGEYQDLVDQFWNFVKRVSSDDGAEDLQKKVIIAALAIQIVSKRHFLHFYTRLLPKNTSLFYWVTHEKVSGFGNMVWPVQCDL